ncbi:LysR family transcriptional regulator [Azoarcus sp. DD4]|uniref:winged helix-turn-helix domain-containing protein n=1 Tax=Azoarcus sp. DD4 TaxID=2027405 RepID=UPI001127CBEF|nr:LysR family transcriptional regulator [Azoarcus sp. DD4]QDF96507.1 LysR family transcriptional regulator [Azoarcus sp. DD4]
MSDPEQSPSAGSAPLQIGARVRVLLGESVAIGPGKADVLEGIRDTGSIAAAGRRLGMGYKRVWLLVESMNRCFSGPLVEASKGGARGGGARLTDLGEEVLQRYRRMQALAEAAIADEVAALQESLRRRDAGGDAPTS